MRSASTLTDPRHVILDTGFRDDRHLQAAMARHGRLHYLAVAPVLPAADCLQLAALRALWPQNLPGLHRLQLEDGRVMVDVLVGPLENWLAEIGARIDTFLLPAPIAALRGLGRLATTAATLELEECAGLDLDALRAAGFSWSLPAPLSGPMQAQYTSRKPQPPRAPPPQRQAVVIGAGVAGAAAAERLCARGWQVTLIERHAQPAQEASGNRAGIFMPLLSRDDNIPTRLTRAAYLYALRSWQRLGGMADDHSRPIHGAQCGVLQLARDAEHAVLQQELVREWRYPEGFVRWLDAGQAGALLGTATPHGAWLFPQGGWANPASVCRTMLAACGERLQRVFHAEALTLQRHGDNWQVLGANGQLLASAPNLILANGAGASGIAQTAALPLYTMRGQVTHVAQDGFPKLPLVVCREAYLTPSVDGIVSVGATYDKDGERTLRQASQDENLARAADILGPLPASYPLQGRAALRCMAPDRLPLVGALPDQAAGQGAERLRDLARHPGLYGLLGYASRGLIWAPLAAELLACQLEGEAPPLETTLATALDPARFLLKARRKL
jgi:tRNA 5-methylaminomethyl-2-thiouridine biosynthesis bifunctional protein